MRGAARARLHRLNAYGTPSELQRHFDAAAFYGEGREVVRGWGQVGEGATAAGSDEEETEAVLGGAVVRGLEEAEADLIAGGRVGW